MKTITRFFLLTLIILPEIFAQGSSIYSRYGIGDLFLSSSARRNGFGGLGVALEDKYFLNDINPAGWNKLALTRFEIGATIDRLSIESFQGESTFNEFTFSGLSFGVPLEKDLGISLVGGLIPYSNVDYTISFLNTGDITGDYTIDYTGKGGISKFFIGSSYRLPLDFSVGLAYEYYTGKIDYTSNVSFPDSIGYEDGGYKKHNEYRGMGLNMGLISGNIADLFDSGIFNEIRFGLSYNKFLNLKSDTTLIAVSSLGSISLEHNIVDVKVPDRIGFGVHIRLADDYNFMIDYLNQNWTEYTIDGQKSSYLNNMKKYSFGFEYKKQNVTVLTPTLEQVIWRCGLSFGTTNYRINNNEIDQFSLYAGVSYPVDFGSSLDIGLEYSTRGKTENYLLKENIFKVYFALSIGELWFIRQDK